jgi:hypothetical protein
MKPITSHCVEQVYSVRFVVRPEYSEFYPLRDAWLDEMANASVDQSSSEYFDGRFRKVVRTRFRSAKLVVAPHEWGVEYVIAFALGVSSGVVANVIYDLLKEQVPRYAEMLKKLSSKGCRDIRIEIEFGRSHETVKVDVIEPGRGPVSISLTKLTNVIDGSDIKQSARRRPTTSKKRKKK